MKKECATCIYFHRHIWQREQPKPTPPSAQGECFRYPPVLKGSTDFHQRYNSMTYLCEGPHMPVTHYNWSRPIVHESEYCGEWEALKCQ